jgi:hypothetical protein
MVERIRKDLYDLEKKFTDARESLSQISLSWFDSTVTTENLRHAKYLAKRGELATYHINKEINDSISQ